MVSQLFHSSEFFSQKLGARKQKVLADESAPLACLAKKRSVQGSIWSPRQTHRKVSKLPFVKSEEDALLQKCNRVFTRESICLGVLAGSAGLSQAVTKVALQARREIPPFPRQQSSTL